MPPDVPSTAEVRTGACTHTGALYGIMAEWRQLWERCPHATPFQTPEWLVTWWRHFGRGGLWTLCFRDVDGRLVGVAPLYVQTADGLRTVRLVGAGLSDYLDVLCEESWRQAVVRALLDELDRYPERWDVAEFQQLPAESPLLHTDGRHADETVDGEPCPVLRLESLAPGPRAALGGPAAASPDLPASLDSELRRDLLRPRGGAISVRLLTNIAQDQRRLQRAFGNAAVETATIATAAELFAELRRLHAARWNARGKPGVLADDDAWSFHEEAARALFGHGVVRLLALRAGAAIRGVLYVFHAGDRASYYLGGFDPECRQYGIGNQLVAHAIRAAAGEGLQYFDFLRGREAYKYRWGAQDTATFCRRLYRNPVLRHGSPEIFQPRVDSSESAVRSVA